MVVTVVACAVTIAAALVAVSAIGSRGETSSTVVSGSAETSAMLRGVPQHGNVLGSPKAPVTITEYADFQCPYCARFSIETLPTLVQDYVRTGKVKLVFRGIAIIGPDSVPPLQAAFAAGEQNRLWNYAELVYRNQGEENSGWVSDGLLKSLGEAVPGLDAGKMMDARGSTSVQAAVTEAQNAWVNAGLRYTPTFVVVHNDGQRNVIEGALPVGAFRHAITGS
jgi:protein-disulfide isomerase